METITVKRIAATTLFKLLFIGSVINHLILCFIIFLAMIFGTPSAGQESSFVVDFGFLAGYLAGGIFLIPFSAVFFMLLIWPGIWLFSRFKPIKIGYIPNEI